MRSSPCMKWNCYQVFPMKFKLIFHSIPYKLFWGCSKGTRKLPLSNPFANFSRPRKIGIIFSCAYIFINSGMQTFREPFAALSRCYAAATKRTHTYIHICKCHASNLSGSSMFYKIKDYIISPSRLITCILW